MPGDDGGPHHTVHAVRPHQQVRDQLVRASRGLHGDHDPLGVLPDVDHPVPGAQLRVACPVPQQVVQVGAVQGEHRAHVVLRRNPGGGVGQPAAARGA